jgi:hypothetical protein
MKLSIGCHLIYIKTLKIIIKNIVIVQKNLWSRKKFEKNLCFMEWCVHQFKKWCKKNPEKKLYIISIKMVNVIMNDIICNHKYKNDTK